MANGRQKGAAFERLVCKMLHDDLGDYNWRRDLEQYRAGDRGDIICNASSFPFVIECKRYAGNSFSASWWKQSTTSAKEQGKFAALVYKFDRRPICVRLHLATVMGNADFDDDLWVEVSWETFMYLTREIWNNEFTYTTGETSPS